jgi:SAM-dependent methyltransferase
LTTEGCQYVRMADERPADPRPHLHRRMAESFGGDPERYDRTRPGYPKALLARIIASSPGRIILDVGCGTGIEARQFQTADCTVLGVEPDERMADFANGSGVDVEIATFEDWDPAGRVFDAVIAGTAWHWVDPVAGAVKAAQVLRPNGLLAPFHHVFQTPSEVAEAMGAVYQRVVPDSPLNLSEQLLRSAVTAYQPLFAAIADGMRQADAFSEPEQWRFDWTQDYSRDEWLDQLPTFGGLTQLPQEKLKQIQEATGAAIDDLGGQVTVAYSTIAVTAIRVADVD